MINLLKIGLSCCEEDVLARMELKEVTEKIERLKEGGNDHDEHFCDGYVQSINGSGDGFFSHGWLGVMQTFEVWFVAPADNWL